MNEMDYRDNYRDENYRGDYRNYREDYREDYRNYRDDYRDYDERDYNDRRDYDRRGGRRNYRSQDSHAELEKIMQDIRKQSRKLEDAAEEASTQDRNMLLKIAQKEKENYMYLKQLIEK